MKRPERQADKRIDSNVQSAIGRKLRESYQEVANAPVPDRFLELLDRLEQGGKPTARDDASDSRGKDDSTDD